MATTWDWGPVAQGLNGLMMHYAQKRQYENLLKTLGTGMQAPPFGGPSSAPPQPFPTARREDDNGMPIPGAPAPIQQAQGLAPQSNGPLGLGILPALFGQRGGNDVLGGPGRPSTRDMQNDVIGGPVGGGMPPQFADILRKLPPQIGMPLLLQTMQQQMMPGKAPEPVKVGKGERLIDPRTGRPIYEPPTEDGDPFTLNEGDRRYNAKGELIVDNPKAPPSPTKTQAQQDAEALGYQPGTPEYNQYIRERTLPRAPQTTINNNMGNSLASGVGGGAADILKESRASAAGALPSIETGNRILQALDSGKVITGPGASFRLFGAQLFGDPETLQQTRTVIQGLADATLNARGELKGQGQITEYEQKTLEKARSGNIDDLTAQEIRTIVRVNDRLARTRIRNHKATLGNIKGADVPENFLQIYNVDEPPEYQPSKPSGGGGFKYLGVEK